MQGSSEIIREVHPAACYRRGMEREPARTGRIETLRTECQLRTERPVVDLQAGVRKPVRHHGRQNKQPDCFYPDARTNSGTGTAGSASGRSRATSGFKQVPRTKAGLERSEPASRRPTGYARTAEARAYPRREDGRT